MSDRKSKQIVIGLTLFLFMAIYALIIAAGISSVRRSAGRQRLPVGYKTAGGRNIVYD